MKEVLRTTGFLIFIGALYACIVYAAAKESGALRTKQDHAVERSTKISAQTQDAALGTINLNWQQADTIRVQRQMITECRAALKKIRSGR